MTRRTLTLKRETLTELSAADLGSVVGGAPPTLNVRECVPSFDVHTCVDCLTRWCD